MNPVLNVFLSLLQGSYATNGLVDFAHLLGLPASPAPAARDVSVDKDPYANMK